MSQRLASTPVAWSSPVFLRCFALMLVIAAGLRWFFYTGFYGSDEVSYVEAAAKLLRGDLSPSGYIGAIRYGFQLPLAGFMALFGQNEVAASLWTLLCSVGEVGLVMLFGSRLFGMRAGILAGLLLATLPLHVHYAGRIMADPPLSFFMTLSVVLFWLGQCHGRRSAFFAAGLAAGFVFWIKESTVLYLVLFLSFPVVFRVWNWSWLWMVAGFLVMFAGNLGFFWMIAGDPFYVFKVAGHSVANYLNNNPGFATAVDAPSFYLEYLFAKPYHTWLIGFAAAAGVLLWLKEGRAARTGRDGLTFIVWWAAGMLAVFSLLPVSLNPLKLITKQVNYMLVFMAPLALLGGYALSSLSRRQLLGALVVCILPALLLSAMEKNVISVFTANSKAAVQLALAQPELPVFGPTGAQRAAVFHNLMNPVTDRIRIRPIEELLASPASDNRPTNGYAVIDTATASWGTSGLRSVADAPSCWIPKGILVPVDDLALPQVFRFAQALAESLLPERFQGSVQHRLSTMTQPGPAYWFEVPHKPCETASGSNRRPA